MSIVSLDKAKPGNAARALDSFVDQVREAVAGIRFGSVEFVIHEGRVVQIERRERVRLERQGSGETNG